MAWHSSHCECTYFSPPKPSSISEAEKPLISSRSLQEPFLVCKMQRSPLLRFSAVASDKHRSGLSVRSRANKSGSLTWPKSNDSLIAHFCPIAQIRKNGVSLCESSCNLGRRKNEGDYIWQPPPQHRGALQSCGLAIGKTPLDDCGDAVTLNCFSSFGLSQLGQLVFSLPRTSNSNSLWQSEQTYS